MAEKWIAQFGAGKFTACKWRKRKFCWNDGSIRKQEVFNDDPGQLDRFQPQLLAATPTQVVGMGNDLLSEKLNAVCGIVSCIWRHWLLILGGADTSLTGQNPPWVTRAGHFWHPWEILMLKATHSSNNLIQGSVNENEFLMGIVIVQTDKKSSLIIGLQISKFKRLPAIMPFWS